MPAPAETASAKAAVASEVKKELEEPSLDTLYAYATRYVDSYCQKRGLDPANEDRRWNNTWKANVEQAVSDNIDSSEQSYINRMVISKRDYFNLELA